MQILKTLGQIVRPIQKRAGLYVSRPVLNGDAWFKWAEKYGVPNPVPPEKMHVTIIASRVDVKIAPHKGPYQAWSSSGAIIALGVDHDVLAFGWSDWTLYDRHWNFRQAGAVSDWPEFRPHVTLSYGAKGFEISDEALANMPPSFVFGDEVYSDFGPAADEAKENAETDGETDAIVVVTAVMCGAAKGALTQQLAKSSMDLLDQQTLAMVASSADVRKSSLDRLLLNDEVRQALTKTAPIEVEPSKPSGTLLKGGDEDRMVYGFTTVSVSKAEGHVIDSHNHAITTKAIRELAHGLIKGQRAGKLLHKGDKATDIVESMVFDPPLWGAIGEYLHKIGEIDADGLEVFKSIKLEAHLAGFHVEDDGLWAFAKSHDFELSIGAEEGYLAEVKVDG